MRHIFLSVVLAFGLGAFACGDDDPEPTKDSGVPAADQAVTTPDQAITPDPDKGPQPDGAEPPLECDPEGTLNCNNVDDCALLDTGDKRDIVSDKAAACGMGCLDEEDPSACSMTCMADGTTGAGLSAECSGCYVGILMCVMQNCIAHCVPDSDTDNCIACQKNEEVSPPNTNGVNCLGDFYGCSGLPVPTI